MGDKELIKAILHYQQCLDKYTRRNDEARVLYCLSKLYKMPVNIGHLQETGVGRTVNALRKHNGEIGDAAKALVGKWKEMVTADGEENDAKETSKAEAIKNNENKDRHKPLKEKSSSSHRDSDKKKSTSNSASEEDSKHSSRKSKEETRHRHRESRNSKKNKDKHKSSKRKHSSDDSDEEESDYEARTNKDHSKHSSEEREVKPEKKHKHSKRDNSVIENDNQEFVKSKRKKYSESENSDEEQDANEKKHSHKSSKHHEKKEKTKHEHKKDKKEKSSESKSKEEVKHKEKSSSSGGSSSKSSSKSDKRDKDKESKSDNKSKHSSKNSDHSKKSKKSSYDVGNHSMGENGIGSGSGASFAEALGMLTPGSSKVSKKKVAVIHPLNVEKSPPPSRDSSPDTAPVKIPELLSPKKLTPLDIRMDNLLPEITPNYRPLGIAIDNGLMKNKLSSEDETLSAIMYNKISRTKVYSGNKVAWGKVPSLFEICTRVLQDNIDALEYTGGVPYLILKPVIERANPDQLFMLEHHNPYLIEDTDELWQLHCNKEFRNKRREEMETWRDMYMRCLDEREAKLRALTANIKQSQDKSLPVRQTKLAYVDSIVKPPRNIARKQAKHGTGGAVEKKPSVTPSSRLNALATSGAAGQVSVPNPGARAVSSSGSSTAVVKPKKAPLMQKTLALMKSRIFRR